MHVSPNQTNQKFACLLCFIIFLLHILTKLLAQFANSHCIFFLIIEKIIGKKSQNTLKMLEQMLYKAEVCYLTIRILVVLFDLVDVCIILCSAVWFTYCYAYVFISLMQSISHSYKRYIRQRSVIMLMRSFLLLTTVSCNKFTNIRWLEGSESVG